MATTASGTSDGPALEMTQRGLQSVRPEVVSNAVEQKSAGCPMAFKVLMGIVIVMILAIVALLIYQCTKKSSNNSDSCNINILKTQPQQPMMARAQRSRMQHQNTRPHPSPPRHNAPAVPHNSPQHHSPQQAHRYAHDNSMQPANRSIYNKHPNRFDEMVEIVTGPYVYPPTQYQQPIYDAPAPMPQSQLMQQPSMPVEDVYLPGVPSSSTIIGEAQMDIMTTENQGTSIDSFSDTNYLMDPAMMTPGGASDIMGLQTFMPYMGGGVGDNDNQNNGEIGGPVDPNTGLPLFTTGKLIRSQLLGGHGASSFLRQVQDPLSGYRKSVGKNLCGVQQARRDVEVRRKQLNAARLEHPDADPILFNTSDFAYN